MPLARAAMGLVANRNPPDSCVICLNSRIKTPCVAFQYLLLLILLRLHLLAA